MYAAHYTHLPVSETGQDGTKRKHRGSFELGASTASRTATITRLQLRLDGSNEGVSEYEQLSMLCAEHSIGHRRVDLI